jgi:hypothetical protein
MTGYTEAETIARAFHEAYERLAPDHGYKTREASAKPWEDVPDGNKGLMIATVQALLNSGVIAEPQWEDIGWYRVVDAEGEPWCETSELDEAASALTEVNGGKLQCLQERRETRWIDIEPGAAS